MESAPHTVVLSPSLGCRDLSLVLVLYRTQTRRRSCATPSSLVCSPHHPRAKIHPRAKVNNGCLGARVAHEVLNRTIFHTVTYGCYLPVPNRNHTDTIPTAYSYRTDTMVLPSRCRTVTTPYHTVPYHTIPYHYHCHTCTVTPCHEYRINPAIVIFARLAEGGCRRLG